MGEGTKKISVVIPVYNAEPYLQKNIGDLLQQTYRNFELIYVNDGSIDDSLRILQNYQEIDGRIRVIDQKNAGAGNARNTGFSYVTGEYVLFLDADDRFSPKLLERAVSGAETRGTDVLIFDAGCFDAASGEEIFSDWIVKRDKLPVKKVFRYFDLPEDIFTFSHNVAWNKLFRVSFLRGNHLLFQEVPHTNDTLFMCMALVKAERIAFLDEKLIYYRQNSVGSLTGRGVRQANPLCVCEVLSAIQEELKKAHIYNSVWKSFANLSAEQLLWNLEVLEGEAFSSLFRKIKISLLRLYDITQLEKDEFLREELYDKTKKLQETNEIEYLFYLVGEKNRIISDFSRTVYRMQDMLSFLKNKKQWVFADSKVPKGSRIVLYGAGDIGSDYYVQFERTKDYVLAAWADKNYKNLNQKGRRVISPETIMDFEFDYIIIAVMDRDTADNIKNQLIKKGVEEEKIIWPLL